MMLWPRYLCVDVASTFTAFIGIAIQECLGNVAMRLCRLPFQHPSLITWQPELLMQTIHFLLSQCKGNHRSNFAAAAVPLAELATTMNIYPRLADVKHSLPSSLQLWTFMSRAEIFVLLCVFLQWVCRQLGPSQIKLDFKIDACQRPAHLQPELSVISVGPSEFEERVQLVLLHNLGLSPWDFRLTGTNEWFVAIEDIDSVMRQLPTEWRRTDSRPPATNRQRRASSESRESSSASSSDGCKKRKVLLATPLVVSATSSGKVPQGANVTPRPASVTMSSTSRDINDRDHRHVVAVHLSAPSVQPQPPAGRGLAAASPSAILPVAPPVVDFTLPPPRLYSSRPSSAACPSQLNYPSSFHNHTARPDLASVASPVQMVMPVGYSSAHVASNSMISPSLAPTAVPPVILSQPVAFSSAAVFPAYTSVAASSQVTASAYCLPAQYSPYRHQTSSVQFPAFQSPLVAGSRMTTAGSFSGCVTFVKFLI